MKRVIKAPDIRKQEIIQVAKTLFESHGYEQTSVEAIIRTIGIAKGTFYYYFKSKKDILVALVEWLTLELVAFFQSIIDRHDLSAIEKLQIMLTSPEKQEKTVPVVMTALHKPENRQLQEQLNIKTIQMIAPLIAQVIESGIQEGVFPYAKPPRNSAISDGRLSIYLRIRII